MIVEATEQCHGGDSPLEIFKMASPPRPLPGPPDPSTIAAKDVGVVHREIALHTFDVSLFGNCWLVRY